MSKTPLNRREVLQSGGALIAAAATLKPLEASGEEQPAQPKDRVRVGFVGVGAKGWHHMQHLLHIKGVEMVAVCDIVEARCRVTQKACRELGMPEPTSYHRGEYDFRRMCAEEDLDLVYTATPWRWHVPVCLAAMKSGAHAATEIPAAITLDECWQLVETSEKTGRHLSMMENVNYRREELMILRMIREGALGELIHAEAGYMHDTRYLKIRDFGDGLWLGAHHAERNGNLYPCHGIGPMAWNFDLGRGNRMEYLVSMSSKARGMNLYAREHLPEGHPYRERNYINGDVNSSLIQTARGESILITHDTDLPRPYSRTNLVQGTRGIVRGFPEFLVSLEQKAKSLRGHSNRNGLREVTTSISSIIRSGRSSLTLPPGHQRPRTVTNSRKKSTRAITLKIIVSFRHCARVLLRTSTSTTPQAGALSPPSASNQWQIAVKRSTFPTSQKANGRRANS